VIYKSYDLKSNSVSDKQLKTTIPRFEQAIKGIAKDIAFTNKNEIKS